MGRILSLLPFVLLAVGLFFLPRPEPATLAALDAHALFGETLREALDEESGETSAVSFGDHIRESTHWVWEEAQPGEAPDEAGSRRATFFLSGVRFAGVAEENVSIHSDLRRSVVRGLREQAAGVELEIQGELFPVVRGAAFLGTYQDGELTLEYQPVSGEPATIRQAYHPPGLASLFPPLIAIALAVLLRRPLPALFCGVLFGAVVLRLQEGSGALASLPLGLVDVGTRFLWPEAIDTDRQLIILFVLLMLGMVGVLSANGGLQGLMDAVARLASSAKRTQLATYLMGLVVFFDDYANTILVGATMRPLTDRFQVAREKLAYIVDSTAAPVAGISLFSTWIAFQVSTFSAHLPAAGLSPEAGYEVVMQTLPYRFYCFLALGFVGLVAVTGLDFGPMSRAERRARSGGGLVAPGSQPMVGSEGSELESMLPPKALRAVLPVLTFVLVTLLLILYRGGAFVMESAELFTLRGISQVLADGSGNEPLAIGSLAGFLLAAFFSLASGLGAGQVAGAAWKVLRTMGVAILILFHAWMIGGVCKALGTAPYLTALIGDSFNALLLPLIVFVVAAAVAFATGSSWSTMSILNPLVVGLAYNLGEHASAQYPHLSGMLLMVMCISAVLEGSIFGDHCSPISDTTVMSSISCASDHIDHVRTQAPYALLVMGVAMAAGYLPGAFFGVSPWLSLAGGLVLLFLLLRLLGRKSDPATA